MRYSLAATLAGILDDQEGALEMLEPFAEAAKLVPHLKLLECDPSWAAIRDSDRFRALLQRIKKRIEAL